MTCISATEDFRKFASCAADLSMTSRETRCGFWVAMPTGQLLVWQARMAMQPMAWIAAFGLFTAVYAPILTTPRVREKRS